VPASGSVTVPTGTNSQTFTVTGGAVSSSTPVTLTATTGTTSAMGMLTVTPSLTANPTSLTFSGTQITVQSASMSFTLVNNTSSSVSITSIALGGADPGDFAFQATGTCPLTGGMLAGNSSCTVVVTFTPTQGGSRAATVVVTSPAPGNSVTVTLSGQGFHWVNLTWTECAPSPTCPAVNNFNVYRLLVANGTSTCPTSGYGTSPVNPSPIPYSTSPSYADIGLTAGDTYCYVVTAVNGAGESAPSGPTAPPVVIPSP
jgi:hypothetical protein